MNPIKIIRRLKWSIESFIRYLKMDKDIGSYWHDD